MFKKLNKKTILISFIPLVIFLLGLCVLRIRFLIPHSEDSVSLINKTSLSSKRNISKKVIKLLFVGDIMLDRNIRLAAQRKGNYNFILNDIKPLLLKENMVIANLEGPITTNSSLSIYSRPGEKNNFIFTFSPQVANLLYQNNIKIVNLGNNHIMNFGQDGLEETIVFLKKNKIDFFGQPGDKNNFLIKNFEGYKIGFLNYNQFDKESLIRLINQIKNLRRRVNFLIIYTHWGNEYQTTANQKEISLAHKFINLGADLIIGSHPHVIQNEETYKGKRIYYSLGNFIFDQYFSMEVRRGLIVQLKIWPSSKQTSYGEFYIFLAKDGRTILEKRLNY